IDPSILLLLIISPLTGSTEIRGRSCGLGPAVAKNAFGVSSIEHLLRGEPGAPTDGNSVAGVIELRRIVGVRVDGEQDPGLVRLARPLVVEVQAVGTAVDLEGGAGPTGFGDDGIQVDHGFAAAVETAGSRMGEDVDMGG